MKKWLKKHWEVLGMIAGLGITFFGIILMYWLVFVKLAL